MAENITRDTIWMKYPSTWWHDLWREGLVSGNGVTGADVYGGVKDETVMLTHSDLWHNGRAEELPDVSDAFRRQRELMDQERFQEASWEVVNALKEKGYGAELQSPFPAADLKLQIEPVCGFSEYVRGIHMDSGEVFAQWKDGGRELVSQLFVSRAHGAAVKRIVSGESDLSVRLWLEPHKNCGSGGLERWGKHILDSKELQTEPPYMMYTAVNDDGKLYGVCAKLYIADGEMHKDGNYVCVKNSREILILIKVFAGADTARKSEILQGILGELDRLPCEYGVLLDAHRQIHEGWYRSAGLSLEYEGENHSNEELLMEAYQGKQSLELIEKLWKYGRYLFISGTDEKGKPFPMYGLWAGDYRLMWAHNMANENIQMIYWHTYAGNLLPFQKAFYQYYDEKIPAFQENARKLFGMRGIYMTAGTTPGVSAPNQVVPVIMNWVGAAGWIAQHYYQYYRYTGDMEYLREKLLPFLLEAAAFYEDFAEYYPDGSIHFYPSVSPENTPGNFMPPKHVHMAHPMPTTVNSTIDLAILKEFFTNMCRIAEEASISEERITIWKNIVSSIPKYQTNSQGAVREWQDERFEERYDHRHLSHIYPVFPGKEVNSLHEKELLPAFERAVELREIDAQTGWSMAHMAAIYARLEKGERALECLDHMAQSSLINNFFTLHNDWRGMNISLNMESAPVQLDAVMGYVNAVQEMLLYSSEDLVKLLPALPDRMSKGSLCNFRYENGLVDMSWDLEAGTFRASLRAIRAHTVWLQLPKYAADCELEKKHCQCSREDGLFRLEMQTDGVLVIEKKG